MTILDLDQSGLQDT